MSHTRPRPVAVHIAPDDRTRLHSIAHAHQLSISEVVRIALAPVLAGRAEVALAEVAAKVGGILDRSRCAALVDDLIRATVPSTGTATAEARRLAQAEAELRRALDKVEAACQALDAARAEIELNADIAEAS